MHMWTVINLLNTMHMQPNAAVIINVISYFAEANKTTLYDIIERHVVSFE